MQIDHVQLSMPKGQVDVARTFYRDVLEMTEIPSPRRWLRLVTRLGRERMVIMSRVIVTEFITLDGVIQEPSLWQRGYSTDDGTFKRDELFASDGLLLGRVTYQEFVAYWPTATVTGEFGERMNALPKFVATTTLDSLEWNATKLAGDVVAAVEELKRQDLGNLLTYGSATLVQTLLKHRLVDELRLMVYPLILGSGKRLFPDGARVPLELLSHRDLGGGVLLLTYGPAAERAS